MRRWVLSLLLVTACHFQAGELAGAPGDAGDAGGADGPDPDGTQSAIAVAHVGAGDEAMLTSTATWTVASPTKLDTGTGMAMPPLPAGLFAKVVPQEGGGPDLFVIQGARIEIGATLRVVGSRPLVLVATGEIVVSSMIDASADHLTPGPGGAGPSEGPGAGPDGKTDDGTHDAGGAGASFGTSGMHGGDGGPGSGTVVTTAPAALPPYGDAMLATLQGGSGGGDPSPMCATDRKYGGAGGGAVQLTAPTIMLDGTISVGGGGAEEVASCDGNGEGGGGGGSGGALYLQATTLQGTGVLAANGGGGSGTADGQGDPGYAGENGRPDTTAALGGIGQFGDGGDGAALLDALPGLQGDNGGGGGGGAGRIFLDVPASASVAVTTSPAATRR